MTDRFARIREGLKQMTSTDEKNKLANEYIRGYNDGEKNICNQLERILEYERQRIKKELLVKEQSRSTKTAKEYFLILRKDFSKGFGGD